MKVLMIGDLIYTHVRRWAVGLQSQGVDLAVLSARGDRLPGVRELSASVPPLRPWRPKRWLERWRSIFRDALDQARPDVIHVQFPGPFCVLLEEIGAIPLIVSTWGAEIIPMRPDSEDARRSKIEILRRANLVVASSRYLADATERYAELNPGKVSVQYWGVDLEQFVPPSRPGRGPVIGFAKTLLPKYGAEYLVDALPNVLRSVPEARVLMLGKGQQGSLKERAARLGVADAIDWIGQVDHADIPSYFERMALSVMPSVHESETLGVSALESQAMRVPVVASNIGGIPESVLDGETGILVPPRDPRALSEAITMLLVNNDLRFGLGRCGRSHIEQRFDWKCTINSMIKNYQEVLF